MPRVLLQMLIRKREKVFDQLNGMFAFAFLDVETGEWILARDHFGIKPLYYTEALNGQILFASEIKALLAHPQVQAAASMHSEYMADTGDFGHFERGDPKRRTPGDRMNLCGYTSGGGENCYAGSASPRSAHDGWLHSSGHHRNILAPGHREMASGVVGNYWTQNFGRNTGFLNALRIWRD